MALQLILGNSGAGKSHYLFEKIIADPEGSGNDASAAWHHEY